MIEQVYALRVAAEIIPMTSVHALYVFLGRHKDLFPSRYKRIGRHEIRVLYESEILRIRDMIFLSASESRYRHTGRRQAQAQDQEVIFADLFANE